MNDSNSFNPRSHRDSFGPMASHFNMTSDLHSLFLRGGQLADDNDQALDTSHLLVVALSAGVDSQRTLLGDNIPRDVQRGLLGLAQNHARELPSRVSTGSQPTQKIDRCLARAGAMVGGQAMGVEVVIFALLATDGEAMGWFTSVCQMTGHSVDALYDHLRIAAENSLDTWGSAARILNIQPAQVRADTQAMLDHSQVEDMPLNIFATAHATTLRNIAQEMGARAAFDPRIPLVLGPKGSGQERIAQALVGAPKARLPFAWSFEGAYFMSMAQVLGRANAADILATALEITEPQRVLALIDAQVLDYSARDTAQAQECLDLLIAQKPGNVILVYRTDDTGKLPHNSRFIPEIFRDFRVPAQDVPNTRQFVTQHFVAYWREVENVTVAADAFEDVYPISPYIYENDIHFNLPYLPVIMGTNAAQTVKNGSGAILATVDEAQRRLREAQNATKTNQALDSAFSDYFATLQKELATLRDRPGPRTSQGLPLVTRELVTAELAASAVYLFQWPIIAASGVLAPISSVRYPTEGGRQGTGGDR